METLWKDDPNSPEKYDEKFTQKGTLHNIDEECSFNPKKAEKFDPSKSMFKSKAYHKYF